RSLDDAPPRLRGWEWAYFDSLVRGGAVELPSRGRLDSVCSSSDGSRIFAAAANGALYAWGTATRQVIRQFAFPDPSPWKWGVSRDGRSLLIAFPEELTLFDVDSGQAIWRRPLQAALGRRCFRGDGAVCAVGLPAEGRVLLLAAGAGEEQGHVDLQHRG